MTETVAESLDRDGVDYVDHKSLHQHRAGFIVRDAARTHVKESLVVELSGSGAVAALDIVVVDYELRLGMHLRRIGGKDIVVGLEGFGELRLGKDFDKSAESTLRFIVEHIAEKLV